MCKSNFSFPVKSQLVYWYNDLREKDINLEIVCICLDRDEQNYEKCCGNMPWLALPFSEQALKRKICRKLQVSVISALYLKTDTCYSYNILVQV